jgi:hypothetical protein
MGSKRGLLPIRRVFGTEVVPVRTAKLLPMRDRDVAGFTSA